jgi:hypothetical protein
MLPFVPIESMSSSVQLVCMCFSALAAVLSMFWIRH